MTSGASLRRSPRPLRLCPRGLGGLLRDAPSVTRKSLYTYSLLLIMSHYCHHWAINRLLCRSRCRHLSLRHSRNTNEMRSCTACKKAFYPKSASEKAGGPAVRRASTARRAGRREGRQGPKRKIAELSTDAPIFERGTRLARALCWTLLLMMMYLMTTKDERGEGGEGEGSAEKRRDGEGCF